MARYCQSCGHCRNNKDDRCPECRSKGFSIKKTMTHVNWLRKNKKIKTTHIIVVGPEDLRDERFICKRMDRLCRNLQDVFIHAGGSKGLYKVVTNWAFNKYWNGYSFYHHKQTRSKISREMYLQRNQEMLGNKKIKAVIIFNDGEDMGAQNMIAECKRRKKQHFVVNYI